MQTQTHNSDIDQGKLAKPNSLSKSDWQARAKSHREAICRWTKPYRIRRRARQSHPVQDFLFVYYRYSSKKLETWHPGAGVRLEGAADHRRQFPDQAYRRVDGNDLVCDSKMMSLKLQTSLRWIVDLLKRTQQNRPNFSCFGLHEWAMVYHGQDVRHEKTTKLRLSQKEIDDVVQSRPLTCTHFDAFRFYAIDAKPLNRTQLTLEDRPSQEQPACIHANMDLYKWAFRSMPWIGSDLLSRCFELALLAREIDMRASPYDLSDLADGQQYPPIKIETAEGRIEYELRQREIAQQAAMLRGELISRIESVLENAQRHRPSDNLGFDSGPDVT